MRETPADPANVALYGVLVVVPEPLGELAPGLGTDAVGGAAGDGVQLVADVEELLTGAFEVRVRHVDEPAGDERLEHGRVAEAAERLLEVGYGGVGELAGAGTACREHPVQLGEPGPRVAAPVREQLGAKPERHGGIAGDVPGVEEAEGDARVLPGRLRHLGQGADGVVEVGTGVPERVPDLPRDRRDVDGVERVEVDEHDVEVAARGELAAAVAADRDQRDAVRR